MRYTSILIPLLFVRWDYSCYEMLHLLNVSLASQTGCKRIVVYKRTIILLVFKRLSDIAFYPLYMSWMAHSMGRSSPISLYRGYGSDTSSLWTRFCMTKHVEL